MGIIESIALLLAIAIAGLLLVASRKPDRFKFQRTQFIKATPERVFPLIDDLRQMNTWNPYALREGPGAGTYSGPQNGAGARYDFDGRKSGTGFIEIVQTVPPAQAVLRLVMTKPVKADNTVTFDLKPEGDGTLVTWGIAGPQPFTGKLMATLIDCEKMMGGDFEKGLANLKAIAER